jgi:hypothetical protein
LEFFFLIASAAVGALLWSSRLEARLSSRVQALEKTPHEIRSGGYVSSETCRSCHPDQYHSWHRSFHRTMTQRATPEAVRGTFTNATLTLRGETYRLFQRGDGL